MELELRLHPDDATRLPRLPCVASVVRGQPHSRGVRLAWHDNPDRALAAADLTLVEERAAWRLERLLPADDGQWPPGTPPPVLERAAAPAAFDHRLPNHLTPVAGFDGRMTSWELAGGEPAEAAKAPIVLGRLRGAVAGQPACRVLLAGEDAAVRELALAIADALRLDVAPAGLAAEALAGAHALPLPHRSPVPLLRDSMSVGEAFAAVLGHQTEIILRCAAAALDPRAGVEPVHEIRVALRRLRSCFAVFRPAVQCDHVREAEAALKVLGARLAPVRDWDVFLSETAPAVLAALDDARLHRLFRAAQRRRDACRDALREFLQDSAFRRFGIALAWLSATTAWHAAVPPEGQALLHSEVPPFAAAALHRRMRRLLGAAEGLETLPPPALHRLRLRAKRMRYVAEVFASVYPGKAARRFLRRLGRVQQRLGDLNDAVVAGALLAELDAAPRHGWAAGVVQGFAAARAAHGRAGVTRAWDRFRHATVFWE